MFREWPLKSGAEEDSQVRRSRSFSTTVTELDAALQQSVLAANSEQLRGSRGSRVSGGDGSTSSSGHLRHDARQPIQFHPRTTTAPPLALATVAADGDLLSPLQSPLRTMLAQSPSAQTELRAASSSEEEEFTGGMEGDVLDDNDPTSASDRTTIRRSNAMPIQQPTQRYERSNSNAAVNDDVHGRSGDIMSSRRIRIAPGESGDEKEEEEATAATGDVHRMRVGIDDRITPSNDDAHGSSTTESAADDSYFRQAMRRRATKDAPREEQR